MTSSRPYLIRAINEWILDNALTPYLLVNAEATGVDVPRRYVDNGKIVLNINPGAISSLQIANDHIEFSARFGGTPMLVYIPMAAVLAIYAKENGRGMMFNEDDDVSPPPSGPDSAPRGGGRPALKVVK
ncbi:MAG: ClpXP protease specificity-enhancing factor [Gammaproteobacteria bacterium]|nr:ClpXP protease specificity-enhancing factor [Gammaproteobacteria bacterium]